MKTNQHQLESGRRWGRRDFLKAGALAASGLALRGVMGAGRAPGQEPWERYIPADKRLAGSWVRALFERGAPLTHTKSRNELRYVGMPVGGICCGTLYLGGDGRLWNWDIFNQKTEGVLPRRVQWSEVGMDFQTGDSAIRPRDGATYVKPAVPSDSPSIAQGFAIRVETEGRAEVRALDESGWAEVEFTGSYPIGRVAYSDPACPVRVQMEAFSPFIPLNAEDSGIPATVFVFRLTHTGPGRVQVRLGGWQQNATCFYSGSAALGARYNTIVQGRQSRGVAMEFRRPEAKKGAERPDLVLEDFENGWGGWKREGTAFGESPTRRSSVPGYQGDVGGEGDHVVNSHAGAPGGDVGAKDNATGRLISDRFVIQRRFLSFYIGGGRRPEVGLRLVMDGSVVRQATGHDGNRMRRDSFDLAGWEGKEAHLEIVDEATGGWGNIGVDHLVQTDRVGVPLEQKPDHGTMAFAVLGGMGRMAIHAALDAAQLPGGMFERPNAGRVASGSAPVAALVTDLELGPGESREVRFVLAWHFPRTTLPVPDARTGNYYGRRFSDATAVVAYVAKELERLERLTRLWRDTWYESTLPHWFLDRTFANTSILATTTAHRFGSGRFWGWEGIGCCEGTCTHVWHYAQAMGRIFPELERDLRERVDFGVGFEMSSGVVRHRGEGTGPAIDGQCGRILGVWREHQMSGDGAFLRRVWPRVKLAAEYILKHDTDGDGVLDGAQENTLDAAWYGQIAWITSLSLAALRAVEEMALEMGDGSFAARCRGQYLRAREAVENRLFNGEFFVQIADPARPRSLGTYGACHIDQVHGQSWAWQVGLGRVIDREKTLSALRSLWRYNFAPDVGPFRRTFTAGRPYALPGEAGLVMTSNPKGIPNVYGLPSWQIGYFNECMTGFEHQVASHMIAEGLVLEGFAITRAIHDRYHASRRNPYNEIECSDHYARAMASYGSFVAACGFEYHGPRGRIGFAPRLTPGNFRAAFTVAEGWGSYEQTRADGTQTHRVEIRFGRLRCATLVVELPAGERPDSVRVFAGKEPLEVEWTLKGSRVEIAFRKPVVVRPGTVLRADVGLG